MIMAILSQDVSLFQILHRANIVSVIELTVSIMTRLTNVLLAVHVHVVHGLISGYISQIFGGLSDSW